MKRKLSITFFFVAIILIAVGLALIPLDIDPMDEAVFKGAVHLEESEIGQFYEVLADESVEVREIEQLNDSGHYLVSFNLKAPLDFPYGQITYIGDENWVVGLTVILLILGIAAFVSHSYCFPSNQDDYVICWWQVDWEDKEDKNVK